LKDDHAKTLEENDTREPKLLWIGLSPNDRPELDFGGERPPAGGASPPLRSVVRTS